MNPILVVEDEQPIRELICLVLEPLGRPVQTAADGLTASRMLDCTAYDLVLLDVMLPGIDGFTLMPQLVDSGTPVIFLTAKGSVTDRVRGLRMGADDYIVKPFEPAELLARAEGVLRRAGRGSHILKAFDVEIEPVSRTVSQNGRPVALAPREFDLLLFLVRNRGIVLHRDVIYERVWGGDNETDTRVLDLNIQRLRKKLGWSSHIRTVYRIGYLLEGAP